MCRRPEDESPRPAAHSGAGARAMRAAPLRERGQRSRTAARGRGRRRRDAVSGSHTAAAAAAAAAAASPRSQPVAAVAAAAVTAAAAELLPGIAWPAVFRVTCRGDIAAVLEEGGRRTGWGKQVHTAPHGLWAALRAQRSVLAATHGNRSSQLGSSQPCSRTRRSGTVARKCPCGAAGSSGRCRVPAPRARLITKPSRECGK